MAIIDLNAEVGRLMPVPAGPPGEQAFTENPALTPYSATLLTRYQELRGACASLAMVGGEPVEAVRAGVGTWLDASEGAGVAYMSTGETEDPERAAFDRFGRLMSYLRHYGAAVRLFEVDASETLVDAVRVHNQEAVAGTGEPNVQSFQILADDPMAVMPILRYVPENRREELLRGLPEPLAALGRIAQTPPEPQAAPEELLATEGQTEVGRLGRLWASARALGHRALEKMNLAHPEAQMFERMVRVPGMGELKFVSYFDHPDFAELTEKINEGQRRAFVGHKLWKQGAKGGVVSGPNVEILAFLGPDGEPLASMRKAHIAGGRDAVNGLPYLDKFTAADALDQKGFAELRERARGRKLVAITSLWKNKGLPSILTSALYSEAFRSSASQEHIWVMCPNTHELRLLQRAFGDEVVRVFSEKPIALSDDTVTETARVTAAYVDTGTAICTMLQVITRKENAADLRSRVAGYVQDLTLACMIGCSVKGFLPSGTSKTKHGSV